MDFSIQANGPALQDPRSGKPWPAGGDARAWIEITRLEPREITLTMPYAAAYTRQHGFVHAGIVATALDNACGGAAFSLTPEDADSRSIFSPRPGAIHSFLGARS
jgi:acyl-coenzyme A thioesterase PaaI-like protein